MSPELSDEQLETLLEWSSSLILVVDPEGTVLYVTPSSERLLGYDQGDLVGEQLRDHVHPDDHDVVDEAFERFGQAGETVTVESDYRIARAEGRWRWFELEAVRPMGATQEGRVVVSRPVDERKEREQALDRLAVVNRVLRHDLRNDVHVILNWLDGLTTIAEHDGEDETPMERIRNAGRHMAQLTEEARAFEERILGDEGDPGTEGTLEPVLEDVIERRREMFPNATFHVEDVPACTVRVPEMLDSVFRNLLNNAVQHNDGEEPTVEIVFEERDDAVAVAVADDGPGIPDDRKSALFPDDRTDIDTTETGVGLTIVKQVVDSVGGDVRVLDRSAFDGVDDGDGGAVFLVTLPKTERNYVDELLS